MSLTILDLGADIIENGIFPFLSCASVLSLGRTCTQFKELVHSPCHWNHRYAREFYLDSIEVPGTGIERYRKRYEAKLYVFGLGSQELLCNGPIVDFGFLRLGMGFLVRRPESTSIRTLDNRVQTLQTAGSRCLRVRGFALQGLNNNQIRQWDCYDSEGWTFGDDAEWVRGAQTTGILTDRRAPSVLFDLVDWKSKRLNDPTISAVDSIDPTINEEVPTILDLEHEIRSAHPDGVDHLLVCNSTVLVAVGCVLKVFRSGAEPMVRELDYPVRKLDMRWESALILDTSGLLYTVNIDPPDDLYYMVRDSSAGFHQMSIEPGQHLPLMKDVVDFTNVRSLLCLTKDGKIWSENGGGSGLWVGIHSPQAGQATVMIGPSGRDEAGNVAAVCLGSN